MNERTYQRAVAKAFGKAQKKINKLRAKCFYPNCKRKEPPPVLNTSNFKTIGGVTWLEKQNMICMVMTLKPLLTSNVRAI